MSVFLKQSTQIKVRIGPAVAVGDGYTPVTTLSLASADEAELLKRDGAATVDISGATMAAVTGCDGWYDLTLTTSHTDTLGELVVVIQDDSLILPIHKTFQVVPANTYDSLVSGTDYLDTNAIQVSGGSPSTQFNAACDTALADMFGAIISDSINDASATTTGFTVTTNVGSDVRVGILRLTSGTLAGESRLVSWTGTTVAVLSQASMPTALKQFSAAPANGVTFDFRPL